MVQLVKNLQFALGERIQELTWMGDSTKVKAMEKLDAFHVKIGYPDKWRDYAPLDITDSYYATSNVPISLKCLCFELGKNVDVDEWLMTPQTVNAYYNPTTNEICFPAGIHNIRFLHECRRSF